MKSEGVVTSSATLKSREYVNAVDRVIDQLVDHVCDLKDGDSVGVSLLVNGKQVGTSTTDSWTVKVERDDFHVKHTSQVFTDVSEEDASSLTQLFTPVSGTIINF